MKKKIIGLMILVMLLSVTSTVFAAGPAEYTIDVRNRTGAPVELNYRGADGISHWVTVSEGVSSLTLTEGVYSYWADPKCGHIAGTMNLSQQRQILWISCDDAVPSMIVTKTEHKKKNGGGTDLSGYCPEGGQWEVFNSPSLQVSILIGCGGWDFTNIFQWTNTHVPEVQWGGNGPVSFDTWWNVYCPQYYNGYGSLDLYYDLEGVVSPNGPIPWCGAVDYFAGK